MAICLAFASFMARSIGSNSGLHALAGQTWSLVTLNSKGLTPRSELGTAAIDGQALVGASSFRQPAFRITKDFNQTLWFALAAEAPQTTFANVCNNVVSNTGPVTATTVGAYSVTCLVTGTGSSVGQTGQLQQFSLNQMPDVIAKTAYEFQLPDRKIHIEGAAMYRDFYDRVNIGAVGINRETHGFAFQAGIVAPIIPKYLDFQATTLFGQGIGRYAAAGFSDATLGTDGSVAPIRGFDFQGGLTLHATPELDFYAFGGLEQQSASYGILNGTYVGYGVPGLNDTGCYVENGTCAGNTRRVGQFTAGVWDKVYSGAFGYVRAGAEYIYTRRTLFSGAGPNGSTITPVADDHSVEMSLRYYPF